MKILRGIIGFIMMPIMLVVGIAGAILMIVSIELQPENFVNLTTDIIADTLSKDNLKKIKVSDIQEYLPAEAKANLPADATMEEVVPIAFNNLTGIESYISLEAVEQMIEDDVIKDFTMAVLNEERYDLVGLVDKYGVQLNAHEKELLAEVDTSILKEELAKQGYDIDNLISAEIGINTETGEVNSGAAQNPLAQYLALLQPGIIAAILIAALVIFYLIFSLIFWNFKTGLVWWGIGIGLVGAIILVLNGMKFEFVKFGLGFVKMDINMVILTPAIERLARPVIISGVIYLVSGIAAVVGGEFWLRTKNKDES